MYENQTAKVEQYDLALGIADIEITLLENKNQLLIRKNELQAPPNFWQKTWSWFKFVLISGAVYSAGAIIGF